jgi:very-short-patch-repair endonuclease/predicted transcriptional regulator of viral defense system
MEDRSQQSKISRRAWGLARRQHWVVTREQLLGLGLSASGIKRRVARGRLHPVGRGVYAVGRPHLTQQGRWMAAVLGCGPGAVLSHGSAAALWGFGYEGSRQIEVSVVGAARRRPEIRSHRISPLNPVDRTEHQGIPVTGPVRTLVDLAKTLPSLALERAVNEADKRDLTDPDSLRTALPRFASHRGVGRLRTLLDRLTFRLSDSDLEIFFRPIARDAGLPAPQSKQMVNGFEVDFFWPDLGLVIETDGLRYHRTPSQQNRGLRRDQTHTATGMTPLRFSHSQIKFEPDYVRSKLAAVTELLRQR